MKTETTKKSVAEKRELINHKIKSNIEHNKSTKQNSQEIYSFTGLRRLEDERCLITNDALRGNQKTYTDNSSGIKSVKLTGMNMGGYNEI